MNLGWPCPPGAMPNIRAFWMIVHCFLFSVCHGAKRFIAHGVPEGREVIQTEHQEQVPSKKRGFSILVHIDLLPADSEIVKLSRKRQM